jgi:NitT/TauT family transport system substrate-binding protein
MKRSLRLLVAGTAAAALLAACGGGGSSGQPGATASAGGTAAGKTEAITVGVIPIIDVAPIYLGVEKGFFSDRGLDVKLESGQGGAAIVPGVVSGQFQFGFSNVTSLLLASSQGLPLKVVTAGNYSTGEQGHDFGGVVVNADSPIKDAAGLAGKTVSVNTLKNIGDTTVRESIRKAGGDPDTVKFVELAFPDMPAALKEGRIDAAWVVEPFLSISKDQGARVVAWNFVDTDPNLMIAAYFTSEQLEKSNPEMVKNFTEAMNESLEYTQAHPDEARKALLTYTKIDEKVAQELTLPKWSSEINTASVQRLADLAEQDKLVDKKVDVNALLP